MKSVSLIIPVYNEADAVPVFLRTVGATLAPLERAYTFSLIFINDGSSDRTLDVLVEAVAADPRVNVVDLSRHFGKEAALAAGLDLAEGDAVIPIDVDLQEPPSLIPRLIEKWEEGFEVVLARRSDRSSDSYSKRQFAVWFYRVHNMVAEPSIPADVGDFRLLDRSVVAALRQLPEQRRFMKGLFAWVGFRTASIDYQREPRRVGSTKFSTWRLWNLALEGITSFSIAPLRIWTYLGAVVAGSAFLYMIYTVVKALIHGIDTPGYASLLATVLFLGGIQLIGIGIIGEYLGRAYVESKRRPPYFVRGRHGRDLPTAP